jgi:hypothetical protein
MPAAGKGKRKTAASKTASKEPKEPRELSPLDAYRVALLAAITASNGGVTPPNRDREWGPQGARRFYDWPGGPAAIDDVVACYEAQRAAPRWDTEYLSLTFLATTYGAWRHSPENYCAGIARKRAAADGRLTSDRAHTSGNERRTGATTHDHNPRTTAGDTAGDTAHESAIRNLRMAGKDAWRATFGRGAPIQLTDFLADYIPAHAAEYLGAQFSAADVARAISGDAAGAGDAPPERTPGPTTPALRLRPVYTADATDW